MMTCKVVNQALHCGDSIVKKVWHFDSYKSDSFTREHMEQELLALFSDAREKDWLLLYYFDNFTGKATVDSDAKVKNSLAAFEGFNSDDEAVPLKYLSLHCEECFATSRK